MIDTENSPREESVFHAHPVENLSLVGPVSICDLPSHRRDNIWKPRMNTEDLDAKQARDLIRSLSPHSSLSCCGIKDESLILV